MEQLVLRTICTLLVGLQVANAAQMPDSVVSSLILFDRDLIRHPTELA